VTASRYGRPKMARAVERLEIALLWERAWLENTAIQERDGNRPPLRVARARKAYFARMEKTQQRNWVVMGDFK
jgi:hypothetical protein